MKIESAYLGRNSKPGQFVEVRCSDDAEPLLRRPLSIHRISKTGIELLYEVIGKGTELLSRKKAGQALDIIGPLGNGFKVHPGKAILVAGGVGVAPLMALAEKLAESSKLKAQKVCVIIGAKTKDHILCEKDFKRLGCNVSVATENGSKGRKGLATDLLKDFLRTTNDERRTTIYACGPVGMLREVTNIAAGRNIPCQVSLEEHMACGVGVCLGCPVRVKSLHEYKMVCKDGPIFNAAEIIW